MSQAHSEKTTRRGLRPGAASILALVAVVSAAGLAATTKGVPDGDRMPVPVLVELFTSEGCSSCPPADEVLARLAATQPITGAEILALGEHVDYWDDLGWRDPFSSPAFSQRQSDYADRVFRQGNVYTPQLVVDGREELIGSDSGAALAAVKRAADRPDQRLRVALELRPVPSSRSIAATLTVAAPAPEARLAADAEVLVAVTQDGLESRVRAGENAGRRLRHSAVVRSLQPLGVISAGQDGWSGDSRLERPKAAKPDQCRVVAFVQERQSRKILGAASAACPAL